MVYQTPFGTKPGGTPWTPSGGDGRPPDSPACASRGRPCGPTSPLLARRASREGRPPHPRRRAEGPRARADEGAVPPPRAPPKSPGLVIGHWSQGGGRSTSPHVPPKTGFRVRGSDAPCGGVAERPPAGNRSRKGRHWMTSAAHISACLQVDRLCQVRSRWPGVQDTPSTASYLDTLLAALRVRIFFRTLGL